MELEFNTTSLFTLGKRTSKDRKTNKKYSASGYPLYRRGVGGEAFKTDNYEQDVHKNKQENV